MTSHSLIRSNIYGFIVVLKWDLVRNICMAVSDGQDDCNNTVKVCRQFGLNAKNKEQVYLKEEMTLSLWYQKNSFLLNVYNT